MKIQTTFPKSVPYGNLSRCRYHIVVSSGLCTFLICVFQLEMSSEALKVHDVHVQEAHARGYHPGDADGFSLTGTV